MGEIFAGSCESKQSISRDSSAIGQLEEHKKKAHRKNVSNWTSCSVGNSAIFNNSGNMQKAVQMKKTKPVKASFWPEATLDGTGKNHAGVLESLVFL